MLRRMDRKRYFSGHPHPRERSVYPSGTHTQIPQGYFWNETFKMFIMWIHLHQKGNCSFTQSVSTM